MADRRQKSDMYSNSPAFDKFYIKVALKIVPLLHWQHSIYMNSKLLEPVDYFAKPVKTSLWAIL